jgi:hypothetical protein
MKKLQKLGIGIACLLLLGNVGVAAAEYWNVVESPQNFIVNGQPVDTASLNVNDRNYLQIAEFAELLNIDIAFDKSNDTVELDTTGQFDGVRPIERLAVTDVESVTIQISHSAEPTCVVARVTPDNKIIYQEFESGYDYFSDPEREPVLTKEKTFSDGTFERLVSSLSENSFMTLPEKIELTNHAMLEGTEIYIEVQTKETTHKVGGFEPIYENEGFNDVYFALNNLVSSTEESQ